jgi:hypothetical protein
MAIAIYALSAITATLCSVLLIRACLRNRLRLLFWSGICFAALALEGVILIVNEFVAADLTTLRLSVPLAGLAALLYGMLWETDSQ